MINRRSLTTLACSWCLLVVLSVPPVVFAAKGSSSLAAIAAEKDIAAFLQRSNNTCGLGVLAYLLNQYTDKDVDQGDLSALLASRYPLTGGKPPEAGYSFSDLSYALEQYQLTPTVFRASPEQLSQWLAAHAPIARGAGGGDRVPMVVLRLHPAGRAHYVALVAYDSPAKATQAAVSFFDPARGLVRLPLAQLLAQWQESSGTGLLMIAEAVVAG